MNYIMKKTNSKIISFVLIFISVLFISGCAKKIHSQISTPKQNDEIMKLTNQYKQLRDKRKSLPDGKWDNELDNFGCLLQTTLERLGKLLGNSAYTKTDIINIMGKPDEVLFKNKTERLVYFWRGWHDYLYFVCKDGVVQEHRWYFAYE